MASAVRTDVVVVGGGLAGIVTALECLRAGQRVTVLDRDTPERFGGLAWWAFGGMALVDTPLQRRMKIHDSPERALHDWLSFAELTDADVWPRRWAEHYVAHSRARVHDWLHAHGLRFLPAVNWVERGRFGEGGDRAEGGDRILREDMGGELAFCAGQVGQGAADVVFDRAVQIHAAAPLVLAHHRARGARLQTENITTAGSAVNNS